MRYFVIIKYSTNFFKLILNHGQSQAFKWIVKCLTDRLMNRKKNLNEKIQPDVFYLTQEASVLSSQTLIK